MSGPVTSCPACGASVAEDSRFCPSCGAALDADAATLPSPGSLERITTERLTAATQGEFEVLERLGYGAMGSVYLAREIALSRRVAIKVISPHLLEDKSIVARFKLEAQTVAALRHPHIVSLYGVRQLGDLHYFIMDFIDGPPLRSILKAHAPLDVAVTQALLYQIGSALHYAHRRGRGVIHRDIKPANIMVDREGQAVVMDFGISRVGESRSGLTQTGTTIGTPEYMSPEQCKDEELTGASDQYALGVVAYQMLTGEVPFEGSTYAIMMAHASDPPPPILEARPDCPPGVAAAVLRMLAKKPADRFSDVEAAVVALGGAPLGPGDPVRAAIIELADSVATDLGALDDSSPLSPIPSSGRATEIVESGEPESGRARTPSQPPPPVAVPAATAAVSAPATTGGEASRRGWLLAVAGIVVIGGAIAASQMSRGAPADGPGATPPASASASMPRGDSGDPAMAEAGGGDTPGDAADGRPTEVVADGAGRPPPQTRAEDAPATERPTAGGAQRDDQASGDPATGEHTVALMRIAGGDRVISLGDTLELSVAARDAAGDSVTPTALAWLSSDPAVATVADGVVTGVGQGRAHITVSTGLAETGITVAVLALPEMPSREDVLAEVQRFVNLLRHVDEDGVTRFFGRAGRAGAGETLARMREANFAARLARLGTPSRAGNRVQVDFDVDMSWRNARGAQQSLTNTFVAGLRPTQDGWRLAGVSRQRDGGQPHAPAPMGDGG